MKKLFAIALTITTLFSCKPTKVFVAEAKPSSDLSASKIIQKHYNNKQNFKTLYIKSSANYKDDKQSQSVSAEIKIKKDEKILISIRVLGITMAKALITPKEVKYYDKINGNYFDGDYALLSRWLGTDLNFQKVQNMLIGQCLEDLSDGNYQTIKQDNGYKVVSMADANTNIAYYFDAEQFLINKEEIAQPAQGRILQLSYPNHQTFAEAIMPKNLIIDAIQNENRTNISINYNSITFNEELSFPYSVPESYERIIIN
jgi:hypothetical protein